MSSGYRRQLVGAVCVAAGVTLFADTAPGPEPITSDLRLSPDEMAQSLALSHFAWGFLLQLEGTDRETQASEHLLAALTQFPHSPFILRHLVTPWLRERAFERIVTDLTPVAAAHPDAVELQLVLSQALIGLGKPAAAGLGLQGAVEATEWRDPLLVRELFLCYWQAQDYDAARRLLRRARAKPALRDHFVIQQASAVFFNAMARLTDTKDASTRERRRLERRALTHARAAARNVEQIQRPGDVASLVELFTTLEAWQDLAAFVRGLQMARPALSSRELDLVLVRALVRQGREPEALAVLQETSQAQNLTPRHYVEIARLYVELEDLAAAAVFFRQALYVVPNALEIRLALASIELTRQRPEAALKVLGEAANMPPEGHLLRSHAHRRAGRTAAAALALAAAEEQALEDNRHDFFSTDFYLFYAGLCEDLGHTDRAIEKIRKALESDPDSAICANFLGYVLADHNRDLAEAETWVERALATAPESFAYLDSLAWVYYRQQRHQAALQQITLALRHAPPSADPVVLDHAGDICLANGLPLLARMYWQAALSAGAGAHLDIPAKLERLESGASVPDAGSAWSPTTP